MLDELKDAGYDVEFTSHAGAILSVDFPDAVREIVEVILPLRIKVSQLIASGGGQALITQTLGAKFREAGWGFRTIKIESYLDGVLRQGDTETHVIDHAKTFAAGTVLLEIEWNNKDPFFDRDLDTFRRLHASGVMSVGVILTRGASLQAALVDRIASFFKRHAIAEGAQLEAFGAKSRTKRQQEAVARRVARGADVAAALARQFVADKFGQATTHWAKLQERRRRGLGNPCPLVMIGIPGSVLEDD